MLSEFIPRELRVESQRALKTISRFVSIAIKLTYVIDYDHLHSKMNTFLVVDTVALNTTNRFALIGAIREGIVVAGMQARHPSLSANAGLEIMKVDLMEQGATPSEHRIALLLRLDDVVDCGLNKKELWIGKEIHCR